MPDVAPAPQFPERVSAVYETKIGPAVPGNRGPVRFEEGLATDTDIPNEFQKGVMQGYLTAPGRPNRNANVYEKYPEETMAERVHVGSASWVEAPTFLGEFVHGVNNDYAALTYEDEQRSGGRYERVNPACVND
jgi:hypothetical protein